MHHRSLGAGFIAAATLATFAFLVPPASATTPPETDATTATPSSGAEEGAFPVTIETKYGEVTLEEEPERVVSVGFTEQDALLALGVVPVGIRDWYGEQPNAVWPWATDELGDATPTVLSATEINYEAIAELDPDVIIGVSSGMTQEEYDTLSGIAPTIAQSGDVVDYGMPWRDAFRMVAAAVGRPAAAEDIIADIEGRYAAAREAHPEFDGASAAVAFYFDDQPGAYASVDGRSQVLTELGFAIPDEFDELAGEQFFASFSLEQLELLDTDVLIWLASDGAALQETENIPGRTSLDAHTEGREVFTDVELTGAFSFNSPLSLPFVIDQLVPMLAAAVDGDPATTVDG